MQTSTCIISWKTKQSFRQKIRNTRKLDLPSIAWLICQKTNSSSKRQVLASTIPFTYSKITMTAAIDDSNRWMRWTLQRSTGRTKCHRWEISRLVAYAGPPQLHQFRRPSMQSSMSWKSPCLFQSRRWSTVLLCLMPRTATGGDTRRTPGIGRVSMAPNATRTTLTRTQWTSGAKNSRTSGLYRSLLVGKPAGAIAALEG